LLSYNPKRMTTNTTDEKAAPEAEKEEEATEVKK
jgi:hypothetical protein